MFSFLAARKWLTTHSLSLTSQTFIFGSTDCFQYACTRVPHIESDWCCRTERIWLERLPFSLYSIIWSRFAQVGISYQLAWSLMFSVSSPPCQTSTPSTESKLQTITTTRMQKSCCIRVLDKQATHPSLPPLSPLPPPPLPQCVPSRTGGVQRQSRGTNEVFYWPCALIVCVQ